MGLHRGLPEQLDLEGHLALLHIAVHEYSEHLRRSSVFAFAGRDKVSAEYVVYPYTKASVLRHGCTFCTHSVPAAYLGPLNCKDIQYTLASAVLGIAANPLRFPSATQLPVVPSTQQIRHRLKTLCFSDELSRFNLSIPVVGPFPPQRTQLSI